MTHICILSSVHSALDNRVFYREAKSLHNAGYEVTLIAVHEKDEIKDGIKIIGLPNVPRIQRYKLWLKIINYARNINAELFHFHDPELLFVVPWLKFITNKPTIYDVHEVYPDFFKVKDYMPKWLRYPIAWAFKYLEPPLARLQHGLIFSDDNIAKQFSAINRPTETIYNFPSKEFVLAGIEITKGIRNREPIILHLGGHERNRGTDLMVDAFEIVHKEIPQAKLLLVGHYMPPSLQEEVQENVNNKQLESAVKITGRVPFETIGEYLKIAAVGWVPWQPYPKNEKNIPTKLFEYMSYGVPIVSSDLPSTRSFVLNSTNGFRVTANDSNAHAQALIKLLKNPDHGYEMGLKGQDLVSNEYNWGNEEVKLLRLYETILN
jgi:glycosyltransferase involved in cell wall biosynthesis